MAGCGVPSPQSQLTPKVYGILLLAVLAGMAARALSSPSIDPAPGFLPARSWLPALWFVSPYVWRAGAREDGGYRYRVGPRREPYGPADLLCILRRRHSCGAAVRRTQLTRYGPTFAAGSGFARRPGGRY
eukprot:scaffold4434_cov109-Isochrysis_galbana.AAC.13